MDRRQMFAATGAALLAAVAPAGAEPPLSPVYRYSPATDSWSRVRMYELRAGDVFRIGDVGTFRAYADPTKEADGRWGINADYEIDPQTNQWVPSREGGK